MKEKKKKGKCKSKKYKKKGEDIDLYPWGAPHLIRGADRVASRRGVPQGGFWKLRNTCHLTKVAGNHLGFILLSRLYYSTSFISYF